MLKKVIPQALAAAVAFSIGCAPIPADADYFHMRVGFERVPGVEQVLRGNFAAGIAILERELADSNRSERGQVLSSLCGAYVLNRSLDAAAHTCQLAVDASGSNTAYNNRGVLRALTGDFDGAREDFVRVRPADTEAYLEELKVTDIRLMADSNLSLLRDVRRSNKDDNGGLSTSRIEEL